MRFAALSVALPLLASGSVAHDVLDHHKAHMARALPDIQSCQAQFAESAHKAAVAKRHIAKMAELKELGDISNIDAGPHQKNFKVVYNAPIIHDPAVVLGKSHRYAKSWKNLTLTEAFGQANMCSLTPEADIGPLFVGNQHIRSDVREGQPGIPLYLEVQVLNQKNCQPIRNAFINFWAANATGVYSGVNGYPDNGDPNDKTLKYKEHGRGVQPTDQDGIAHFTTNLPGHYLGRANHMHISVYHDVQVYRNGTIRGGHVSHIGQLYMDDAIPHTAMHVWPYSENEVPWTSNVDDPNFLQAATGGDPIINYSLLGRDIRQGVYAWIRVAVDVDAHQTVTGYNLDKRENEGEVPPIAGSVKASQFGTTEDNEPLGLPLPQALPKMYMWGSAFMPKDVNAKPEDTEVEKPSSESPSPEPTTSDKTAPVKRENDFSHMTPPNERHIDHHFDEYLQDHYEEHYHQYDHHEDYHDEPEDDHHDDHHGHDVEHHDDEHHWDRRVVHHDWSSDEYHEEYHEPFYGSQDEHGEHHFEDHDEGCDNEGEDHHHWRRSGDYGHDDEHCDDHDDAEYHEHHERRDNKGSTDANAKNWIALPEALDPAKQMLFCESSCAVNPADEVHSCQSACAAHR